MRGSYLSEVKYFRDFNKSVVLSRAAGTGITGTIQRLVKSLKQTYVFWEQKFLHRSEESALLFNTTYAYNTRVRT